MRFILTIVLDQRRCFLDYRLKRLSQVLRGQKLP